MSARWHVRMRACVRAWVRVYVCVCACVCVLAGMHLEKWKVLKWEPQRMLVLNVQI